MPDRSPQEADEKRSDGSPALVAEHLGHDRFAVVGHDQGSLVAFRTAVGHPASVSWWSWTARAAGRQVRCLALLLESADDDLDIHGDPAAIWASGSPGRGVTAASTAGTTRLSGPRSR